MEGGYAQFISLIYYGINYDLENNQHCEKIVKIGHK